MLPQRFKQRARCCAHDSVAARCNTPARAPFCWATPGSGVVPAAPALVPSTDKRDADKSTAIQAVFDLIMNVTSLSLAHAVCAMPEKLATTLA